MYRYNPKSEEPYTFWLDLFGVDNQIVTVLRQLGELPTRGHPTETSQDIRAGRMYEAKILELFEQLVERVEARYGDG